MWRTRHTTVTVSAARFVVRWERLAIVYEAFCSLACIIICLRELLK